MCRWWWSIWQHCPMKGAGSMVGQISGQAWSAFASASFSITAGHIQQLRRRRIAGLQCIDLQLRSKTHNARIRRHFKRPARSLPGAVAVGAAKLRPSCPRLRAPWPRYRRVECHPTAIDACNDHQTVGTFGRLLDSLGEQHHVHTECPPHPV